MNWHIGCSGFHYREWKTVFYPPKLAQKNWFGFYRQNFSTVELNLTFYNFPKTEGLQKWYQNSPADFLFTVKAPRQITHYKQFNDCDRLLDDFYGTIREGLKEKLGAVLFQFPPQRAFTEAYLEKIICRMQNEFTNVLEFRNASWWNAYVYNELAKHNLTFCSMSYPGLPEEVITNTKTIYYRFHGVPELYRSKYAEDFLHNVYRAIIRQKNLKQAFIYFNNTAEAHAIQNAREFQRFICENCEMESKDSMSHDSE